MQAALITLEFCASFASLYFFHHCNKKSVNWFAALIALSLFAHATSQLKQIGVH